MTASAAPSAALSALETAAQTALATIADPLTSQDWVSSRHLKSLKIEGGTATVDIALGYPARSQGLTDVSMGWPILADRLAALLDQKH